MRAVLIESVEDRKLLVLADSEPSPAGAEASKPRGFDGRFKFLEVAVC
jgi:hypothetical protein